MQKGGQGGLKHASAHALTLACRRHDNSAPAPRRRAAADCDNAAADQGCDTSKGFLDGCASAASATMNSTNFSGAYLYGVDFKEATIQGVNFTNAVLVGASFAGATLLRDPISGTTRFTAAFLQGAKLAEATTIDQVSFVDAFLDFTTGGNQLTLLLGGSNTDFHGWKARGSQVCLSVSYGRDDCARDQLDRHLSGRLAGRMRTGHEPPCGQAANPRWKVASST
jgi:hypothetical protein